MYFNSDYSRAFGLEILVNKKLTANVYGDLELTLSQAMGKASTEEQQYWRGKEETLREWHLNWDRPWKLYFNLGIRYRRGEHPMLFGMKLPDNWRFRVSGSLQAGRRYTPEDSLGIPGEPNSELGPIWSRVDMNLKKGISIGEFDFWLVFGGENILDQKNVYYVNPLTGKDYTPGDPLPAGMDEEDIIYMLDPSRYRAPRSLYVGMEVSW
jgi:hypothetical protein